MKHIRTFVVPDCRECGAEMSPKYQNIGRFDLEHPYGSGVDGWWECPQCGHTSDHVKYRPYSHIERSEVTEKGVKVL